MDSPPDPKLSPRNSIDALKALAEGPTAFDHGAPSGAAPDGAFGEFPDQVIGNYTLLVHAGDGGFGTVWRARQTKPVDRDVALKIVKIGMDTREVVSRFDQERQAVALMDHPHIAKVFDAGTTPSGRPFFAMEWINGEPITTYCDRNKLKIADRLHLFMDVCRAVQHAHQKGVIHRDLKPSNILVTEVDGKPMPKLIDFGVAKALDVSLTDETIGTLHGQIIGTPEYMSPEQAEGDPRGIDTRTDIFALGVLLYELLTGSTPLDSRALRSAGVEAMRRMIHGTKLELPSRRIASSGTKGSQIATTRQTSIQTLQRHVRGELDWIVRHAMDGDKACRYATVAALLDDIEHYGRHEPLSVGPPSLGYRLRKLYQQHKVISTTVGVVILAVTLGGAVALWQWQEADEARRETASQLMETQRQLERSQLEEGRAWLERAKLAWEGKKEPLTALMLAGRAVGFHGFGREEGETSEFGDLLGRKMADPETEAERVKEVDELRRFVEGVKPVFLPNWSSPIRAHHREPVTSVAFSPDGTQLASGSHDNTVKLWDVATGKEVATLEGHSEAVMSVAFSPDGTQLASGSADKTVKLWDVATGKDVATLDGHLDDINSVTFSPDGTRLASGSQDRTVKLWGVDTGKEVATLVGILSYVTSVSFSPDGTRLASGSWDNTVKLWDVATGKEVATLEGHSSSVTSVSFSPDGTRLASGSDDKTVKLWDVATGKEVATLEGHLDVINSVTFSRDGTRLASALADKTVKLWDVATGKGLATLEGHSERVMSVAFSPDGMQLASGSDDKTVKLWDVATGKEVATLEGHSESGTSVAFSPDGTQLASGSADKNVKLWDVATGKEVATLEGHLDDVNSVTFSSDGTRLASGSGDNTVKLWDVATGKEVGTLEGHSSSVRSVTFSPDGTRLASGSQDRTVKLWEVGTGMEVATLEGHSESVTSVAFSPDGTRLASGSWDDTVKLWDVATGKEVATLEGHSSSVTSVAFSPDGTRLVSTSGNDNVKLWDVATGKEVATLDGDSSYVSSATFSPDGTCLASGSRDKTVKLWDVATGNELVTMEGHLDDVFRVTFSRDGTRLVSQSYAHIVKFWDVATGKEVDGVLDFPLVGDTPSSPDGRLIAIHDGDEIHLEFRKSNENHDLHLLIKDEIVSFIGNRVKLNMTNPSLYHPLVFTARHFRQDELAALADPDLMASTATILRLQLMARTSQWRAARAWWAAFHGDDPWELRSDYLFLLLTSARDPVATAVPSSLSELTAEITYYLSQESAAHPRVSLPLAQHVLRMASDPEKCPEPVWQAFASKIREFTTPAWQAGVAAQAVKIREGDDLPAEAQKRLDGLIDLFRGRLSKTHSH